MDFINNNNLILRDKLALERTLMAVERTFLAYFRTSIVFFASGIGILNIHFFKQVDFLGTILIILSPILMIIGIYSLIRAKKNIKKVTQIEQQK